MAVLQDAFPRNAELCLDGRIVREKMFPTDAGGYADVFEGHLESRKVAIKVLRPFRLREEKLFRRLWREYLTWSRLSHPNILACLGYSYDFSPGAYTFPSLISPWMENGSIGSYLQRYPDGDRIKLLVGVAKGLSYLHTCDPIIVHGDLRAGNILVSDNGIPCLTDFGLSRVLEEIHGMTTSSDLAGSVRWMSPELFNSESDVNVSVKSDIWAYGMTILEVLSGERPYSTVKNDIIVIGQIREGKIPFRPPILDDDLWATCMHCWSREPLSRPSVENLIYMLMHPEENPNECNLSQVPLPAESPQAPPQSQLGTAYEFGNNRSWWGLSSLFGRGGERHKPLTTSLPEGGHSMSTRSMVDSRSSLEVSPVASSVTDSNKSRKERDRQAREAEMARLVLMEKMQREKARAVLQRRNQTLKKTNVENDLEWPSMHSNLKVRERAETKGELWGDTTRSSATGVQENKEGRPSLRSKSHRRNADDDHSMSSSDVQSIDKMSILSFALVDSDPGPTRTVRHRPTHSVYALPRATSISSLRKSPGQGLPLAIFSNSPDHGPVLGLDEREQ